MCRVLSWRKKHFPVIAREIVLAFPYLSAVLCPRVAQNGLPASVVCGNIVSYSVLFDIFWVSQKLRRVERSRSGCAKPTFNISHLTYSL